MSNLVRACREGPCLLYIVINWELKNHFQDALFSCLESRCLGLAGRSGLRAGSLSFFPDGLLPRLLGLLLWMSSKSECPKRTWHFYDLTSELMVALPPYSVGTGLHSSKEKRPHTIWEECQCHIVRAYGMTYSVVKIWKIQSTIIYSPIITIHTYPTYEMYSAPSIMPQSIVLLWHPLGSPGSHYIIQVHVQMRLLEFSSLNLSPWKLLLSAWKPVKTYELKRQIIRPLSSPTHTPHTQPRYNNGIGIGWPLQTLIQERRNGETQHPLVHISSEIQPGTHCQFLD